MDAKELRKLKKFSAQLRIDQLEMFKQRGMGHIGGCLSVTELISVLYGKQMKVDPKNPNWEGRDYLVMSKGHAAPAVEAALAELGFFDKKLLLTMDDIGTRIPSHVDRLLTPGIDVTCGSLGQGASVAAGIAYGLKHAGITDQYVYVCIGDGELNEGQNWEAFQFMAHNKLNNCIVFIDNNKRQHDGYCDEVLKPFSYEEKMKAFGFWCKTVDGASEEAIDDGINEAKAVKDQAVCIVLDTIKGQGVKYYEDRIMVLDADLGGASFFLRFKKSHPDRFVDCGICEANMVGVAAGLSLRGYIPVVHTMSAFVARRALDQLYISCAYQNNTINVFGSDPGICSGFDGGTHTCFEDLAIMRTIPHAIVCDPCDQVQLDWMVRECLSRNDGAIHYIRAYRKNVTEVYEPGTKFELGKGKVLIPGDEVLLVGSGYLMGDALTAAEELRAQGISVEVVDPVTIKPFDEELILNETKGKKLVVTYENHGTVNGIGSAVADVLAKNGAGVPLLKLGATEIFGQVGMVDLLKEAYKLTAKDAVAEILKAWHKVN